MNSVDFLNWTDEQWEQYENATVNVPLELLDRLCTAAELLAQGARIGKDSRAAWTKLADEGREYTKELT